MKTINHFFLFFQHWVLGVKSKIAERMNEIEQDDFLGPESYKQVY